MQDSFRKSALTLPLPAPLAVANGVVSYIAQHHARIHRAQLCLSDTGTGAGSTEVRVKVNGNDVTGPGDLAIAQGAASKALDMLVSGGSNQYPGGALIQPGDVVTIDVMAVPATTVPKAAFVVLDLIQVDI
jgi:hypothetical protein